MLGFTRAEVSGGLLLGEMAIGIAMALPLGMALGYGLVHLVSSFVSSDQFPFPVVIRPATCAWAGSVVLLAGAAATGDKVRHAKPAWNIQLVVRDWPPLHRGVVNRKLRDFTFRRLEG